MGYSEFDTNPVAGEGIEPAVTDNCDYTDADDFDGYGFDPITMTSCPPLDDGNSSSNVETTDATNDNANAAVENNPDTTDNISDDSIGNSSNATTAENENTAVEDEVVASNTQADSTGTDLVSSDETGSLSSGGGSFWLPVSCTRR